MDHNINKPIPYEGIVPREEIKINEIYSIHYFEFAKDYVFFGEEHNFWEFVYVDKGEIEILAGEKGYLLKKGEIVFHKPYEFHNLWANGKIAPNVFIMSFSCKSSAMRFFENRIQIVPDKLKHHLAAIIKEAQDAFSGPLDRPILPKLSRNANQSFASEQLIRIHLSIFLIELIRYSNKTHTTPDISNTIKAKTEIDLFEKIELYLLNNLNRNITQNELAKWFGISISTLKNIYRNQINTGVIEHFRKLKLNHAKDLIREGNLNMTQISEELGYSSIHHFSHQFKKNTNMSPSEYASSLLAMKKSVQKKSKDKNHE